MSNGEFELGGSICTFCPWNPENHQAVTVLVASALCIHDIAALILNQARKETWAYSFRTTLELGFPRGRDPLPLTIPTVRLFSVTPPPPPPAPPTIFCRDNVLVVYTAGVVKRHAPPRDVARVLECPPDHAQSKLLVEIMDTE